MGPWFIFGQEISNLKSNCRITLYFILYISNILANRLTSRFLRVLRFSPPIKLTATIYNCNLVESGVKHHKLPLHIFCIRIDQSYTVKGNY